MAKAKQAPGVIGSADPYEWAAGILRLRFDEVVSFCGAALVPWNINGVHDMRVAVRRLRSALRDFVQVIDEKPLKRVSKDLKKLADLLGAVRDQDVAIIALEDLTAETGDESIKSGIGELIEDVRTGRERAHGRLQKTLTVASLDDLRERFAATIDDALRQQKLFRPADIKEIAREVIETRLQDVCVSGKSIYLPFDAQQLHKLRIAAKRLRYAIELFAACWEDKIAGFAADLAKLQSFLGEVHDCDVWIGDLSKHLKNKNPTKAHNGSTSAAEAWLLSRFVQKHSKEYRSALDLWSEWEANKFVDRLRAAVTQQ